MAAVFLKCSLFSLYFELKVLEYLSDFGCVHQTSVGSELYHNLCILSLSPTLIVSHKMDANKRERFSQYCTFLS